MNMQHYAIGQHRFLSASPQKKIGLIVLSTDFVSESDFIMMAKASSIGIYANRIPFENPITTASLLALKDNLHEAAHNILPDEPLDAIIFSCTAASTVIGEDNIQKIMFRPLAHIITPTASSVAALRALGAKKIHILTPYPKDISRSVDDFFQNSGFHVQGLTYLDIKDDRRIADIPSNVIAKIAQSINIQNADALFISCTGFRSVCAIKTIEKHIKIPVITSNQASFWNCLKQMKLSYDSETYGQVFRLL